MFGSVIEKMEGGIIALIVTATVLVMIAGFLWLRKRGADDQPSGGLVFSDKSTMDNFLQTRWNAVRPQGGSENYRIPSEQVNENPE